MFPRMDAQWFKDQQRRKGVTSWDLGEALGRDRTIVSRILNGRQAMTFEQAKLFAELLGQPLGEVLTRAGIADERQAKQAIDGFADADAAPWVPAERSGRDRAMAIDLGQKPGIDVWTIQTKAMSLAGYLPGDRILVDSRTPERARPGAIVVAQVYDWQAGSARTVLRQFQRPALVSHSANPADWVAFVVDDTNVAIRGMVVAQWRLFEVS